MAITNTKCKVVDRDRRQLFEAKHGDHVTQPRMLQPIADADNITVGNGFVPAELLPGDMVFAAVSTVGTEPALLIRNAANNGWVEIELSAAVTVAAKSD